MHIPEFCRVLYDCLSSEMKERSNIVEVGKRNQNRTELTELPLFKFTSRISFKICVQLVLISTFEPKKKNCPN